MTQGKDGRSAWVALLVGGLVLGGCGVPAPQAPQPASAVSVRTPPPAPPVRTPAGTVTVAYPGEPAGYLDTRADDPAAADLQSLWGLSLFRTDPDGQLAPGLVEHWEVVGTDPWTVALRLRPGSWSDGSPVTSTDVVATVEALRDGDRAAELAPLRTVEANGPEEVRLAFDRPYARWYAILDGVGVLPAERLADGGLGGYDEELPVTGGPYRLAAAERGLSYTFQAHADGPLGAPGLARVELLVVPRYETALGLVADGTVDVAMGYLALNPVERALRVDGVTAAAPIGGTWVGLTWRPDGPLGGPDAAPRRRALGEAVDVSQLVEGLLGPAGEAATSPVPGGHTPVAVIGDGPRASVGAPTVLVPRWAEAPAFTARAVQRDLRAAGGGLELVSSPAPLFVTEARERFDGALRIVRSGPRPSLVAWLSDAEAAHAADAAVPGDPAFATALEAVEREALVRPLYRVGTAHVWTDRVAGLRPSAWPGLAFWDVGTWTVSDG